MEGSILNYFFAVVFVGLLVGVYLYIGFYVGGKDTNNDLKKHLLIISLITGALVFIYSILTYMYLNANPGNETRYIIFTQALILWLALWGVSASSIQIQPQ